jgi:sugar (pentulose or hexulose) kinase
VNTSAGEGGAWGIAILASYLDASDKTTLDDYLDNVIFKSSEISVAEPDPEISKGYEKFMENYNTYLKTEYAAVE